METEKVSIEDEGMDQTTTGSIEQRIHAFLLEKFPLARKAGVGKDTALLEKGILDSLGILDVVRFLETEFSGVFSDEDLVPKIFHAPGSLCAFILKKIGKSK